MAKEKGFYKASGLDVDIKEYRNDISTVDEVIKTHASYGVGRSSLIVDRVDGAAIKLLFPAFQSSATVFLATKKFGIKNIQDFKNKKIMGIFNKLTLANLFTMMNCENVYVEDLIPIKHSFNINDLINKKVDLLASYISNEPFLLDEQNIKYTICNPKKYGFDFYDDILFTSEHEATNHQDRVISFKEASLKGWEYAFSHIDESVAVILNKYNTQNKSKEALEYEAKELKKLAYYKTDKFGHIDKKNIEKMYDVYNIMGVVKSKKNLDKFIFDKDKNSVNLTDEEKKWIQEHPTLKFSGTNWKPLFIIKNGKMTGIIKDYLNFISQKTGLSFKYLPSNSWQSVLEKFNTQEIDILTGSKYILTEDNIGLISDVYKSYPMAIITNQKYKYIDSLNTLNGKTVALPKNYTSYNYVKKNFKDIKIIPVHDTHEALMLVRNGKADAFIGHMAASLSSISELYLKDLKISGSTQFNYEHVFIVHNKDKILLSIINKALSAMTNEDKAKIDAQWMSVTVEQKTDYTLVVQLVSIALLIVLILLYRSRKLSEYNEKLEFSNKIILEKDKKLKKLNNHLKNSVSDALLELRDAYKLARIGTWVIDVKKGTITWDDFNYEIFSRDKIKNPIETIDNFLDLIHPDDIKKVENAYYRHLKTRVPYFVMHRVVLDDGSIKYLEERGETNFDEKGVPFISKGTTQDVTEQQLAIITLRKKDEQMLQQSRLAQMGEMLSMIAHQWRQPLSAISATTNNLIFKIMLDEVNKETFTNELYLIDNYTQHLSKTIEDFREFFKKDKKKSITTLNEIVESTLDIVRVSIENKNIKIQTNYKCTKKVKTYINELKQVLLNIMKNAEDVLLEKEIANPCICIETNCENNRIILSVKDNGGGIPSQIIDNIFDPYFTTKEKKEGTGIGLYMSKIIIEEHCHGKLYFDTNKYETTFTIELEEGNVD